MKRHVLVLLALQVVAVASEETPGGGRFPKRAYACSTEQFCSGSGAFSEVATRRPGCRNSGVSALCQDAYTQCVPAREPSKSLKHHARKQFAWLDDLTVQFRLNNTFRSQENIKHALRLLSPPKMHVGLFVNLTSTRQSEIIVDVHRTTDSSFFGSLRKT